MIIDASDCLMGRVAVFAAKSALLGEKVDIVNCEKAVISGSRGNILENYLAFDQRGQPQQGPYLQRRPDRLFRRTVRGMLPYKQTRGLAAFKQVMCFIGMPEEFKDKKMEKVKGADVKKLPNLKFITLASLCKSIGWKG